MAKVLIQNVGKAEKIEFVNCSLSAWLRKIEVATNLLSHLFTKGRSQSPLVWLNLVADLGR